MCLPLGCGIAGIDKLMLVLGKEKCDAQTQNRAELRTFVQSGAIRN